MLSNLYAGSTCYPNLYPGSTCYPNLYVGSICYPNLYLGSKEFHRALSDLVNMRTNNPVLGAQAQVCVTCPPDRSNRAPILARPPTYAGIPRGAISGFVGKWFDRRG